MRRSSVYDGEISRRTLLGSALGLAFAPTIGFGQQDPDQAEIARIMKIAETNGLNEFGISKNDQYLAIGNASKSFREECIKALLGLARDYKQHFSFKGFKLVPTQGRLTVIILADRKAFASYLGEDPSKLVGGTYDPNTNDLLVFDNRSADLGPAATKINTMVLMHEAVHQLTFNTGLLRRDRDVPKVIAEGLACYGEVRSPDGKKSKLGGINMRIFSYEATLPSVEILIRDDTRIDPVGANPNPDAYAEAWLLVHFLMTNDKMLPKFRAYLKAIQIRVDASHRVEDWREHFGDFAAFDRELAKHLLKERKK